MFTLLGAFAGTFVRFFRDPWFQRAAGLVVLVIGLLMLGYAFRRGSPRLYAERRPLLERVRPGTAGALPLGVAFAAGWTPCIGPVLAGILAIAATGGTVKGAALLVVYSLGLGLPFLLVGHRRRPAVRRLGWVRRHYRAIAAVSGALLVAVGVLLMTGPFRRFSHRSRASRRGCRRGRGGGGAPSIGAPMTTSSGPTVRQSVALVWRTLRSMRTALILLLILAAAAVIGSLLPQIPNSPERVGQYLAAHGFWGPLFFRAGFFDVYGSWWFVLITTLLFVSLAACLFPRTRAMIRAIRQRPIHARELDGFRHHAEVHVGTGPDEAAVTAARYLRRKRFRVSREGLGIAAEKGVLREVGSLLFHWAFFLLLLGVIVGKGTGFTGRAVVTEGETFVDALPNYSGQLRTGRYFGGGFTGLGLQLLDFEDSYRRNGQPIDFVSRVRFLDREGRPTGTDEVRVNHPASVGGLRIFQEGFGWAPVVDVTLDGRRLWSSPIEMTRDDAPDGVPATAMPWRGAIKLTAPEPDVTITLELWPDFRAFANLQLTGEPTPMFVAVRPVHPVLGVPRRDRRPGGVEPRHERPAPRGPRGSPRRRHERLRPARRRGAPARFPELRHYSVLLISRDVGIPVVLAAAILVLVGLIPSLYVSRRKVWIRAEAAPGGALVKIGGFSLQRKDSFEEEFDRIVRAIGGPREPEAQRPEKVGTS